jgi:hypothetical protein
MFLYTNLRLILNYVLFSINISFVVSSSSVYSLSLFDKHCIRKQTNNINTVENSATPTITPTNSNNSFVVDIYYINI